MERTIKLEKLDAFGGKIEDDNNLKCGEIVFSNNIQFYFSCIFCQRACYKIQEFFRHILYDHFNYLDEYQFSDDEVYSVPNILQLSNKCKPTKKLIPVALKEEPEQIERNDLDRRFENLVSDDTPNSFIKTEIDEEVALDFYFSPIDDPPSSADTTYPAALQNTAQDILHIEILEDTSESGEYEFENVTTFSNENTSDNRTPNTDEEDDDGNNYLDEHDEAHLHSEGDENYANEKQTVKTKEIIFKCTHCRKVFVTETGMKRHIVNVHSVEENYNEKKTVKTKETIFKCSYCRKVFVTETGMKRHIVNVHSGKPDKLICDQCPKTFKNESQLDLHVKRHKGVKPHSCDICGSCFSDKSNLNVHILRHKGIKPHKCTLCEKRFHSTTEQKLHMRSHTGERPFICEVCGRKFSNSGHLCSHRRRHFGEKRFQCDHCEKRFFDRKLLNDHKVMHTDERPFSCDLCGATFQRKKALLQHAKLHSDVKQYVCKICGKSFAQNAGLYSHMKYH